MSQQSGPPPPGYGGTSGASVSDVITQLQNIGRNLSLWVQAFSGRQVFGTFTCAAAPTITVNDTSVASNSNIALIPTNAAAATLVGSGKSPYVSSVSAGTSFVVSTANGVAAAGTETFKYIITTPS